MAEENKDETPTETPPASDTLPFDIDPQAVEESLAALATTLSKWAKKGRYTKVRFKFRGKQLLPDLPLAAVVAAEGLTFYWSGLLRALVVNLAGRSVFEVELVNDSEQELVKGEACLVSGDVEEALTHFQTAVEMDEDNPRAHLKLGVARKLLGQKDAATVSLQEALRLDTVDGPVGKEAQRILETLTVAKR